MTQTNSFRFYNGVIVVLLFLIEPNINQKSLIKIKVLLREEE